MRSPSSRAKSNAGRKLTAGKRQFVAAHPERHDAGCLQLRRPPRHLHRGLRAELPRRIKNPRGSQPAERYALRHIANRYEIRFHVLHAAKHHADGNGDFGIDDVLPD